MNQRQLFSAQIIEKLGAPLIAAVNERAAIAGDLENRAAQKDAETVAALVNKCIQLSITMAASIDLKDSDGQGDAVRLALACVAAPLVSGHYKATGKIPGDNDLKRISAGLESVLTFADNFAAEEQNTKRMEQADPLALRDENQTSVQYLHALAPAVNAITAFSFGQPEKQLAQDVAGKLTSQAQEIAKHDHRDSKLAEYAILAALSSLYATCHRQEVQRLAAMSEEDRAKMAASGGGLSMDTLWDHYARQVEILRLLTSEETSAAPNDTQAGPSREPVSPPPQESPRPRPAEKPAEQPGREAAAEAPPPETPAAPPPEQPPPASPPEQEGASEEETEEETNEGDNDESFNPMAFFKPGTKKQEEGDNEE